MPELALSPARSGGRRGGRAAARPGSRRPAARRSASGPSSGTGAGEALSRAASRPWSRPTSASAGAGPPARARASRSPMWSAGRAFAISLRVRSAGADPAAGDRRPGRAAARSGCAPAGWRTWARARVPRPEPRDRRGLRRGRRGRPLRRGARAGARRTGSDVGAGRPPRARRSLRPAGDARIVDALVSNPPYLTAAEYAALDASVRQWEPGTALESGADGMAATGRLLREGRDVRQAGRVDRAGGGLHPGDGGGGAGLGAAAGARWS